MIDLERLLQEKPFLANEVIAVIDGKRITVQEAAQILKDKNHPLYQKLVEFLQKVGLDPLPQLTEEQWQLALAKWMEYPPDTQIYYQGKWYTVREIIEHIKKRDEIGVIFASMILNSFYELVTR